MSDNKLKIESILFSYGDFISMELICETLEIKEKEVVNLINQLIEKYNSVEYSFQIFCENDKYKMGLKTDYEQVVTNLLSKTEISKNSLKVLSMIAYEGPITKSRLNILLGRYIGTELEYLHNNSFVKYKKKGIGKYYTVTQKFFDYFKIDNVEDLKKNLDRKLDEFIDLKNENVEPEK